MTDLEATRLCAEAMGYEVAKDAEPVHFWRTIGGVGSLRRYDPLHDDAQCMALVKRFGLLLEADCIPPTEWCVHYWVESKIRWQKLTNKDLNRAVVYCVAKMQAAKK